MKNQCVKKVLFCYFHPSKNQNYTPLDIGYVISSIRTKYRDWLPEIVQMSYNQIGEDSSIFTRKDIDLIKFHRPDAAFFFLDNVFWSGGYAFGRAKKIAKTLKREMPEILIGFQSSKISQSESNKILIRGLADYVLKRNPIEFFEGFFESIEKRRDTKHFFGGSTKRSINKDQKKEFISQKNDAIFSSVSPYLSGVMDNFLAKKQTDCRGEFTAFIYSSIGCPFRCYYCSRGTRKDKIVFFSAKRFYDELEYMFDNFGIKSFMLLDDVFMVHSKRLNELISEFSKRKKKNMSFGDISLAAMIRPELVSENFIPLLKKLNIKWLQLGLQTVNPDLQHYMNRVVSIDRIKMVMKKIVQNGIGLHVDLIMGLPSDTLDYFKKTVEFALEVNPTAIQITQLTLGAGTCFDLNKDKYQIVHEKREKDFFVPYVLRASGGVDKNYFTEAVDYVLKKMRKYTSVKWRLSSFHKKYASPDFQ